MKKFLSLVLALVMTMSLVTISAGATEYKDLTDKDEIQYEEAVAVLNRLGIITGYTDGSFQPKTELTRGAAAKIIVSLLIGTEAANNLVATSAPYSDVPVDHTFAGVISYCKTAKIINGYQDGTFRPAGSLSGYAFSKMLLGALGYKGEIEGFTGAGWTMNVAARGNEASLFDRLSFKGNETVNREQACQLALNTLKATMVEYSGGLTVTAGDASVVGGQVRSYKTSNQDFARNIHDRQANVNQSGWWTVEFGEEHFVDLKLLASKRNPGPKPNDLGQPSAEWSYKKVTIGTYPLEADFTFDKQVAHLEDTAAVKRRNLGLSDYKVNADTRLWLNGYEQVGVLAGIEDIADYTDNGTTVEVYVSNTQADLITDVVVIQTQLMEIKRIGSDYVALQMYDNSKSDNTYSSDLTSPLQGFNQFSQNQTIENVQAEDDAYTLLSGLKTGDIVAVVPVSVDHGNRKYEVHDAYVPEKVTGTLTNVDNYGAVATTSTAIAVTVGGTKYNVANWSKDLTNIDANKIKVTRKDVTLYLDKAGNALLAKDVGSTDDWMVVGNFRQNIEDGKLVLTVNGWDISGTELSLNLGPIDKPANIKPGDLVYYTSKTNSNTRDWSISDAASDGVYNVYAGKDTNLTNQPYEIKSSNVKVQLKDYDSATKAFADGTHGTEYVDKSVKFIYVHFDADHEVESVEVKTGVQNVKNEELRMTGYGAVAYDVDADNIADTKDDTQYNMAQAAVKVNKDNLSKTAVKAVVIKGESNDAIATNMLYIRDYHGSAGYDENHKMIYGYTVAMNSKDGLVDEEMTIYSDKELRKGDFASYTLKETGSNLTPFYELRKYNDFTERTTSTFRATITGLWSSNKNLAVLSNYALMQSATAPSPLPKISESINNTLGTGDDANKVSLRNATWVDLTGHDIANVDQLAEYLKNSNTVDVALIVNDNPSNDNFRMVSMIVITRAIGAEDASVVPQVVIEQSPNPANEGQQVTLTAKITNPDELRSANLHYSWKKNGTTAVGSDSATLTVTATEGDVYSVEVENRDKNFAVASKKTESHTLSMVATGTFKVKLNLAGNATIEYQNPTNANGNKSIVVDGGEILVQRGTAVLLDVTIPAGDRALTQGETITTSTGVTAKVVKAVVANGTEVEGAIQLTATRTGSMTLSTDKAPASPKLVMQAPAGFDIQPVSGAKSVQYAAGDPVPETLTLTLAKDKAGTSYEATFMLICKTNGKIENIETLFWGANLTALTTAGSFDDGSNTTKAFVTLKWSKGVTEVAGADGGSLDAAGNVKATTVVQAPKVSEGGAAVKVPGVDPVEPAPTCTCTTKCTTTGNSECPVCKNSQDLATDCKGKAQGATEYTVAKDASLKLTDYTIGDLSVSKAAEGADVTFTLTQTTAAEADNAKTAITITNGSEGDIAGTAVVTTAAVEGGTKDKYTAIAQNDWDSKKSGTVYIVDPDNEGQYKSAGDVSSASWEEGKYFEKGTETVTEKMGVYTVTFKMPAKNVNITAITMAAPKV